MFNYSHSQLFPELRRTQSMRNYDRPKPLSANEKMWIERSREHERRSKDAYVNPMHDSASNYFDEEDVDLPSKIIEKIKNLRTFSGLPSEKKKLSTFFKELETYVKVCAPKIMNIHPMRLDRIMAQVLSYFLCENALMFFAGLSDKEQNSYTLSKKALRMRFGDSLAPSVIQSNLDSIKQT